MADAAKRPRPNESRARSLPLGGERRTLLPERRWPWLARILTTFRDLWTIVETPLAGARGYARKAIGDRRSGIGGKIGRSGERQQADECKPANVHSLALAATGDRLSAVAKKWGVAASASQPAILLSEVDRGVRGWPWRRYSPHGVRRPQRGQIRILSRRRFELRVDPTRLREPHPRTLQRSEQRIITG